MQSDTGSTLEKIRQVRIDKLRRLRELGFDPYPARCERTTDLKTLRDNFEELQGKIFTITGRVLTFRAHGKLAFLVVADAGGKIQLFVRDENLPGEKSKSLSFGELFDLVDVGDFVQATGVLMKTRTEEISLEISSLLVITKALRPLPEKWHGLQDIELRQRKRYLDMVMDPTVRERFMRRSVFWQEVRRFMLHEGFYETNIPVLEHTTGGADAKPFKTHMDAIEQDFYLRISHELPLKRLIGGGFERVFDIGPRFRNEGFSDEHLPEHVAMEFYWAYADYRMGMELTQRLFRQVLLSVWGTTKFDVRGFSIDVGDEWKVLDYAKTIKERFGVNVYSDSEEKMLGLVRKHGIEFAGEQNRNRLADALWKDIRRTLPGPAFVINVPKFLSPLSKVSPEDPRVTERFFVIIAGSELVNAFSELNDPIDQYERFMEQQQLREAGDQEAMMMDYDFIEMLEYGMPPTFGFGMSERVFWFFEGVSAREGVPFPPMRESKE
jgi:lysyl-tRNA synthetase class 2